MVIKKRILLTLLIPTFLLVACDLVEKHLATKLEKEGQPTEYWSEVTTDYGYTSQGNYQSPVDIIAPMDADLPPLEIHYGQTALNFENNGYVFKEKIPVERQKDNSIVIDGKPYYLIQWHWHVPGEHEINGKHAPMEIHFVNRSDDDEYAVIAVMYEYGQENPAIEAMFDAIEVPPAEGQISVNVRDLLPENLSYYYYTGSLTTPPYTEGFAWYVLQHPQYYAKEDKKTYEKLGLEPNAREIQEIQQRQVKKVTVAP